MKLFFTLLIVLTNCALSFACTHTIRLTDTYGDGWNGGIVKVQVNGVDVLTNLGTSFTSGSGPVDFTFNANPGDVITVIETAPGVYPTEMRCSILDASGATIQAAFDPSTAGTPINAFCPSPMVITSIQLTQAAIGSVSNCATNQQILRLEIQTTGSIPLNVTQIMTSYSGTAALTAFTNSKIYYTSTPTFSIATLFGSAPVNSTSYAINGNVNLQSGSNYFWLVYDLNNTGAIGATVDALINQFTCASVNYNASSSPAFNTSNPAGNGVISICTAPGGVTTGLDIWMKADAGIANQAASTTVIQSNGTPPINTTSTIYNYNPFINFTAPAGVYTAGGADPVRQFIKLQGYNDIAGIDYRTLFWAANLTDLTRSNTHLATLDNITNAAPPSTLHGGVNGANASVNEAAYDVNDFGSAASLGTWKRNGTALSINELHTLPKQIISAWSSAGGGTTLNRFFGGQRDGNSGFMGSPRDWRGPVGELIGYTTKVTAVERQKIHGYLAIKYGVTLTENYLTTSGVTNYITLAPYNNNIIGIGRDDVEGLHQKQSHTDNDNVRIYISTLAAMNVSNSGTIANDISYIVAGDNNGAHCTTASSLLEMPAPLTNCVLYSRLEKEWKITRTNMNQAFNMDIQLANCAAPGSVNIADLRVLIDDDGNFSNGGTQCYYNGDGSGIVISYANPYITVSNINTAFHIPNNATKYLTIASVNAATPLPVELLAFNAILNSNSREVDLLWTTQSEENLATFEVQKLIDNEWVWIDEITAHGKPSFIANYSTKDYHPVIGNNYYRLKQIDNNGTFQYSDVRVVNIGESSDFVSLSPNPANNSMQVVLKNVSQYEIEIYDASGRKMILDFNQNSDNSITLNTQNYANGYYTIRIIGEKIHSEKFIIQH